MRTAIRSVRSAGLRGLRVQRSNRQRGRGPPCLETGIPLAGRRRAAAVEPPRPSSREPESKTRSLAQTSCSVLQTDGIHLLKKGRAAHPSRAAAPSLSRMYFGLGPEFPGVDALCWPTEHRSRCVESIAFMWFLHARATAGESDHLPRHECLSVAPLSVAVTMPEARPGRRPIVAGRSSLSSAVASRGSPPRMSCRSKAR